MSECKCDKCGAEVCPHCGTVCGESCDKARIDRLEREIEELKARPAQVVQIPIHIPVPSPPTFIPYCPPYIQPPTYYPPWKITCSALSGGSMGSGTLAGHLSGNFSQ